MGTFGKLSEFEASKEDWQSYVERVDFFFEANNIENVSQKRAILLSSCGASCYKLFRGLVQPAKPGDKSYTELVQLMLDHRRPKPNPIAERFKFNSRNRLPDESIADYVAELRRLTEYCEFGQTLSDMLRDRLVCGINHERIQEKLLSEGAGLTLDKAIQISQSMDSAIVQSTEIRSTLKLTNGTSSHKIPSLVTISLFSA